jgi:hypothetical protein
LEVHGLPKTFAIVYDDIASGAIDVEGHATHRRGQRTLTDGGGRRCCGGWGNRFGGDGRSTEDYDGGCCACARSDEEVASGDCLLRAFGKRFLFSLG